MRLNPNIQLKQTCGINVLVLNKGKNMKMIRLNDTACFLWQKFVDNPSFSIDDMVVALTSEYEIDDATAKADAQSLAERWQEAGLLRQ